MSTIEQTLQEPAVQPTAAAPMLPPIPGYEVLEELGRGGMGVVFKARQVGLNRLVAIKMILSGDLAGESERKRFRAEGEAVAALQHPNIVQVYEVGEYDGKPFLSLEFIGGGSLAQSLSAQQSALPPRETASLMETLARAIHAAHQVGIVHRDLKPANILLASGGSEPSGEGSAGSHSPLAKKVPKITDFGLAKRLDDSSGQTQSGSILGTPSYMAPEQARGKGNLVGPAADIYAIGAILYELLTGRPPFKAESVWDTITQVISEEPIPPTRLQTRAPRDLEIICLKCLQKEPGKRYSSAFALAEDLRRFLDGEPIQARAAGWSERAVKWARRRPALAALAVVSLLAAAALLAGGLVYNARLRSALHDTEEARTEAEDKGRIAVEALRESEESLLRSLIARTHLEWEAGNVSRAAALLNECPPERRRLEWHLLHGLCHSSRDAFRASPLEVTRVAVSPDGKHLVTASGDAIHQTTPGEVCVWVRVTGRNTFTFKGHSGAVTDLSISPDGTWIASASRIVDVMKLFREGKNVPDPPRGEVFVWRLDGTGKPRKLDGCFASVSFSAKGDFLAAAGLDRTVQLWDTKTWGDPAVLRQPKASEDRIARVVFSPDDRQVLAIIDASSQYLRRWDPRTREEMPPLPDMPRDVTTIAVSPDGQRIAVGSRDQTVRIWQDGQLKRTLAGHNDAIESLSFSPDGRWLVSGAMDQTARLWDFNGGKEVCVLRGHEGIVHDVVFAPASAKPGPELVSGGQDGCVRRWTPLAEPNLTPFHGHEKGLTSVALSPDGALLASASTDAGEVRVWNARTRELLHVLEGRSYALAWSPDGHYLAGGGGDAFRSGTPGEIIVWEASKGEELYRVSDHSRFVTTLTWSRDGKELASACADPRASKPADRTGEVILREGLTGTPLRQFRPTHGYVQDLAFHPGGAGLALACSDATVSIHDNTGVEIRKLEGSETTLVALAFDRAGQRLAAAGIGELFVWDMGSGRERLRLRDPGAAMVRSLAFTPDGERLVLAGIDYMRGKGALKILDAHTGREVLALPGQVSVSLSADGHLLASIAVGELFKAGSPRVWNATPSPERFTLSARCGQVFGLAPGPSGQLASAHENKQLRLWDAHTGRERSALSGHSGKVMNVAWIGAGEHLVSSDNAGEVRVWNPITGEQTGLLKDIDKAVWGLDEDGKRAVLGSHDGTVREWDLASTQSEIVGRHDGPVYAVSVSPDRRVIASAGKDGRVRLWDRKGRRELEGPRARESSIYCVRYSPDGRLVAAGGKDEAIVLWDIAGKQESRLSGHTNLIAGVAFSPDGSLLASCSADRTVRVWNVETRREIAVFRGHLAAVRRVAWSADGRTMFSASEDGDIKIWDAPIQP